MTVAFFWDKHFATSKPIPEELPKIKARYVATIDYQCGSRQPSHSKPACNDGNPPSLIWHRLLGKEDIRTGTLAPYSARDVANRSCAKSLARTEAI